jgi:hypothetical protein
MLGMRYRDGCKIIYLVGHATMSQLTCSPKTISTERYSDKERGDSRISRRNSSIHGGERGRELCERVMVAERRGEIDPARRNLGIQQ